MNKTDLKGMDRSELESFASSMNLEPFRGRQIFRWIYQNGAPSFDIMTDLSKQIRSWLSNKAAIGNLKLFKKLDSLDGSSKFLFGLGDGLRIESVLIPEKNRVTLCVSSQAGCAVGCRFCATGKMGFMRNLDAGEIVDQLLQVQKFSRRKISNIVFMGMGEPMLNLKSVMKACEIMGDDYGPSLAQKKITISTVGIVHGLKKFVENVHRLGLAISLHSADEEIRRKIIPAANKNSLNEIMALAKLYTEKTGRRVYFEYLLLGGLTDSIGDAKKLVKAIHGIPCKINLIRYNPVDGLPFKEPKEEDVEKFKEYLYPRTYAVMIRESRGADIKGACGQLAVRTDTN
ncbi:MAG: 23S rRNA (adenine(2503)-C(2))-methyltransferase RlmN [Candidatus Zixiibacteriota bacterium]|nr:MAG: 23S rRNA (adenine(2503)-C(2))-methyltransferase RlmN [candidate division Zixibacteria bacterium]